METTVDVSAFHFHHMPLDEQVEHLTSILEERFDTLNPLWHQVEKRLLQVAYGRSFTYSYNAVQPSADEPTVYDAVGVQKVDGLWGICYTQYDQEVDPKDYRWVPIHRCPANIRVAATVAVPNLYKIVLEATGRFLPKVDSAIANLRDVLKPDED